MDSIEPLRPGAITPAIAGGPARSTAGAFHLPAAEPAQEPTVAAAPIGTAAMDAVSLDAVRERAARERRARRRAEALLATLTAVQRSLLVPTGAEEILSRLADLAADAPEAADPALTDLLRACVLRARVVLALHCSGSGAAGEGAGGKMSE
ncbi:MAG TPA: flagellar assembly protein FliX [Acetobacteraceae bacterium]|nr:flagellar assembly protein FliX [Acetobacteraceae bacterium]